MDDSMDSVSDGGGMSDYSPVRPIKVTKARAPAAKKTAAPAKPRGRPKGATNTAKPKTTKTATKAAPKKRKDDSDDENSDMDMDEDPLDDDESLLQDTPPVKKTAPGPKKTSGKPLADIANESFGLDGTEEPGAKPKKAAGGASGKYQMV
jgi:DNA topoisomerase-2